MDDRDGTMFVADHENHRIVALKPDDHVERVVAGGHGQGNGLDQLNGPTDVLIDKYNNSLVISDQNNRRVMRWSLENGTTHGETVIMNIGCRGLAMDNDGALYVGDVEKHEMRRYPIGDPAGHVVVGGNGRIIE